MIKAIFDSATGNIADFACEAEITEYVCPFFWLSYLSVVSLGWTFLCCNFLYIVLCRCEPLPDGRFYIEVRRSHLLILLQGLHIYFALSLPSTPHFLQLRHIYLEEFTVSICSRCCVPIKVGHWWICFIFAFEILVHAIRTYFNDNRKPWFIACTYIPFFEFDGEDA